jgi:transcription elongation factor Elf1
METELIQCPYCGEELEIAIDLSVKKQEYIEDCQVCCQPMTLVVTVDDALTVVVDARSDS